MGVVAEHLGAHHAVEDHHGGLALSEPGGDASGDVVVALRVAAVVVGAQQRRAVPLVAGDGAEQGEQGVGEESLAGLTVGEHEGHGEGAHVCTAARA